MKACLQQNMARAVAADLIKEECAEQCSSDKKYPVLESQEVPKI